ncbi:MBL fold metallo-hydrolase [Sphingomonas sp.]|uniref:MBL fold metallo-hydrolase n=1 Tax=Sphingomonas sp. TaxID=28214 RepID=UPI0035BBC5BC
MTMAEQNAGDGTQVFVRMYRALGVGSEPYKGLLGDCFLIRIVRPDGARSHILIDCGILMGSPQAAERMKTIARDIVATTGGKLDLIVVTHEHWDHISGFGQAREVFLDGGIDIGRVWMAWTEDAEDPATKAIRQDLDKRSFALATLANRMEAARTSGDPHHASLAADRQAAMAGLDAFLGPVGEDQPAAPTDSPAFAATPMGMKASATARLQGRDILAKLKTAAGDKVDYLIPGMVKEAPGGLRTFVLGPPKAAKFLKKDKPSSGAAQETYFDAPGFEDLLLRVADGGTPDPARDSPFSAVHHRIRRADVESLDPAGVAPGAGLRSETSLRSDTGVLAWLKQRYFAPTDAGGNDLARRRVDADWLGAAGPLAMKLDSDTNNTSLVLAFELPDGTLMLFPGDAQVGNWLSWHEQTYAAGDRTWTAEELLNRVRFYKVGHHGSHNATLDEKGLAMMTHPDLVAAIPTDEDLGKRQGSKGWEMPNARVRQALLKATGGRIFRNDAGKPDEAAWAEDPDTRAFPFPHDFAARLVAKDLYLEYAVHGPGYA